MIPARASIAIGVWLAHGVNDWIGLEPSAPAPHHLVMERQKVFSVLLPVPGQENLVRRRFWAKVRATLGRVRFLSRALAAYYAALDPETPVHVKGVLFAALAYFVLPVDLVPDFLAGLGFTDDATVLLTAVQVLAPYITEKHTRRAAAFLEQEHRFVRRRRA